MKNQLISMQAIEKLQEISGESIKVCMQCGTCTSTCPMALEMDFFPRKVMHYCQFGLVQQITHINSFWKCASCHSCSVRCPRGIDIARVMEALRQLSLREGSNRVEPSKISKDRIKELPGIALVAGFRKLTS